MEGDGFLFKASLKNNNIPELGTVTVEFPIPEAQYEETIRALNGIQSGAVVEQDCFVADIGTADCPALERLIGTMANVDELDWLAREMESFDRYGLLQFNAAVERFGLSAADELIDLSFHSREITVISDFNNLENAGKRHHLTLLTTGVPEEQGALVGTETAQRLIAGQPGHVTQYRGDLTFKDAETINVAEFLHGRVVRQSVQTTAELLEQLSEKMEQNWQTYQRALYERSPGVLIGMADEITATATCHSEFLCSGSDLSRRDLSYLLQFENPLEVLRDRWVLDQSTEQGTRFLGMLESLRSEGHAEQDYPLDEAYAQIQKNEISMQF